MSLKALSFLLAFFLTLCAVQPWNIPIPGLHEDIELRSLQGGSSAPLTEEIQEKSVAKVDPDRSILLLLMSKGENELIGDPRSHFVPLPFFEVPTPPPRG